MAGFQKGNVKHLRVSRVLQAEIQGIKELMEKIGAERLLPAPARRFLNRLGLLVENRGKELVPVDRGQLRSKITHEVSEAKIPTFVKIGTNVAHGRAIHSGWKSESGLMPPVKAIAAWVERKGLTDEEGKPLPAFPIARAIAARGYKDKPDGYQFLDKAVAEIEPRLPVLLNQFGADIQKEWEKG